MSRLIVLFCLSACIPIPISIGQYVTTDNPRQGAWVTGTGHRVIWHVDQPEVVAKACWPGGPHGCVRWTPGETVMALWTIDSARIALHECAHALAFSRAMTQAQIDAEIGGIDWQIALPFLDGPAMQEICGASAIYTGLSDEQGGQLLTVEEWQHRGLP